MDGITSPEPEQKSRTSDAAEIVIGQLRKSGLSADDRGVAVLNSAKQAFSGNAGQLSQPRSDGVPQQ